MKGKQRIIFILVILALYSIPVMCICVLSSKETKKYSQDVDFEFKEMAYGEICAVTRMDMKEYYSYNGSFVSDAEQAFKLPYNAIIHINEDEEVFSDTKIATVDGNDIFAEINGVVSEINYGDSINIKINDTDSLMLECLVPKEQINYFEDDVLYDELNKEIKVVKKSNIMEDGYIKVYLKLSEGQYYYGETLQNFSIYTGNVFHNALVIPTSCIYSKLSDSKYYVRQVSEVGEYLNEVEVTVGYNNGEYACVTGIEEGTYCDTGYALVTDGEDNR